MKTIKIQNGYDLGQKFSNVTLTGAFKKIYQYLKSNQQLLSKFLTYSSQHKISIQSTDINNLLDIIKVIDPSNYFYQNLIRTIKLNVKFNKETKQIQIDNQTIQNFDDANTVSYNVVYQGNIRNNLYFSPQSLLINYQNINDQSITSGSVLTLLYFDKQIVTKNSETSQILSDNITSQVMYLAYDKKSQKLKYIQCSSLNKNNTQFNLSKFVQDYNNNSLNLSDFNISEDIQQNQLKTITYSNFKISKTIINLFQDSEDEIIAFKNSMNKYVFDQFVENQLNLNSQDVE